nr:hypothetical protein [Pandoravirus massiliensis]
MGRQPSWPGDFFPAVFARGPLGCLLFSGHNARTLPGRHKLFRCGLVMLGFHMRARRRNGARTLPMRKAEKRTEKGTEPKTDNKKRSIPLSKEGKKSRCGPVS